MKWGTKYGPDYVNRLYAMVRRHLSGDFRFVCLTDDSKGIRSEVDCFPIPPLNLELAPGQVDRAWKKLTTFEQNLHGLRGTALFVDLDVVVVGSLDEFFELARRIPDHSRLRAPLAPRRITGNSSVYRFELGAHPDVLAHFRQNMDAVQAEFRNEQTYLSDFMYRKGNARLLARGMVPELQVPRHPDLAYNYWREPFVPEGAQDHGLSWGMQSAGCAGGTAQSALPVHPARRAGSRSSGRPDQPSRVPCARAGRRRTPTDRGTWRCPASARA